MTISYCVEWNNLLHQPIDPLTVEQARARHDAGEQYTAVIDRDGQPRHVVTLHLNRDSVHVERLGDHGQPVDVLIFRREADGRLFCSQAIHYHYDIPDPTYADEPARTEGAVFKKDGTMWVRLHERGADEDELLKGPTDLTANWEEDWGFGHYDRLLDFHRKIGALPDDG